MEEFVSITDLETEAKCSLPLNAQHNLPDLVPLRNKKTV